MSRIWVGCKESSEEKIKPYDSVGSTLIWNEVIDKYFCLGIMKFGGAS